MPARKKKTKLRIIKGGKPSVRRKPARTETISITIIPPGKDDSTLTFHTVVETTSMQSVTLDKAVTITIPIDAIRSF